MMLASLSSYSQYPAIKKIGKDSVVIMTLNQGQEINNKFSSLNDSLKVLNKSLLENKSKVNNLKIEKQKLDSILWITSYRLDASDKEIKKMNDFFREREKSYWRERREWGIWMVFSTIVTAVVALAN